MRGTFVIAIFVVLGLMFFGCCGLPTEISEGNQSSTGGVAGTGGSGAGSSSGGTGAQDLSGLGYSALVALGVPLECDITETSEGETISMKLYMDGNDNTRAEVPIEDEGSSGCSKFIFISKGQNTYLGCEGSKYPPGTDCDWMVTKAAEGSTEEMEVEYGSGSSFDTDYSDIPVADIDCKPWVYDASKFQVSGKACTMEDLMAAYTY